MKSFHLLDNIDGSQGEYYAKLNKADRQMPYDFCLYVESKNKMNEQTKQSHRNRENRWLSGAGEGRIVESVRQMKKKNFKLQSKWSRG